MRSISKIVAVLLMVLLPLCVYSQAVIPVTIQVQLPAPRFLHDIPDKTQIMIYPVTVEDVNLRFTLTGDNGIVIRTNPNYSPFNIVLTGGPMVLSSFDFDSYFLAQNLQFSGITANKIAQSGLPPGNYRLCVRVQNSDGAFISGDDPLGCSNNFSILEAEPPFLVNPVCGSVINTEVNNGFIFSWTPAVGAPVFTRYTLRIAEYPLEGMNPAAVLNAATTPMFFEKEMNGFSYFYGPTDPSLQTGKSYAWEVVAQDSETKTWFKNNGRSEACWFKYGSVAGGLNTMLPIIITTPGPTLTPAIFPMSTVSGKLLYAFNSSVSGTTSVPSQGGSANGSGGGIFIGNPTAVPWTGSPSTAFQYNGGLSSANAKPLANVKISLVRKYIIRKGFLRNMGMSSEVENFPIPDVGYQYPTEFNSKFPNSGQVMGTTTTDASGNFSFVFLNSDSIGQVLENFNYSSGPSEFQDNVSGTVYSAFRIIVESPYYCSPDNDIVVQPWEVKNAGDVVSLAKDYNLNIVVKSAETSVQQIGGGGNPLNDVSVSIVRKPAQQGVPNDEGQNINKANPEGAGIIISEGKTKQAGDVLFNRMMRHQKMFNQDRYTIQCKTNPLKGNYNYKVETVRYNYIHEYQMVGFPFTGEQNKTIWNSQYKLENKTFEVKMWPAKPRVYGRITNNAGVPLAGVKCVILSIYKDPKNYAPEKLFRVVESGPEGYFEFNNLDVEMTGPYTNIIVDGPNRTFMVKVNGYKYEQRSIGVLVLGQQTNLGTIALSPDGQVRGHIVDEDGNAVHAKVIFNNEISITTNTIMTVNPFKVYQNFSAAVPSGKVTVKIIPSNPEFETIEYPFTVNKSSEGSVQDLGALKVYNSKHRITFVIREKSTNKPVKDVKVVVKNSDVPSVLSNAQGVVNLSFASMAENFTLDIIPPDEKDLLPLTATITNTNSTTVKDHGAYYLEPAARISGTVTYGIDKKPLAEADVFLEQGSGGTSVLVKTDVSGKYTLGKVPINPVEANITAGKTEPGTTIISQTKLVDISKTKVVDFHLPVFDKMSITEIFGFPVMVESLKDEGSSAIISGRFTKLPANDNFKIDEPNFMMEFENVKMIKLNETSPQGVPLTKPESKEIKTGSTTISLKIQNEYFATHTSTADNFSIKADDNGSGYIDGKVKIENSSFQFSTATLSFQNENLYLSESATATSAIVRTITANPASKKVYALVDEKGGSINYSLLGFDASGQFGKCTIDGAAIKLNTVISTSSIPLMNPQKFELDIGDLIVKKSGFEPLNSQNGFNFKLEKWNVSAEKWYLSKSNNYIVAYNGKMKTGLADVPFNSLNITPSDLAFSGFKFGEMSLSGVVPMEVLTTNINMLYDQATGSDMKPHWRLAAVGVGGQPATRIKGLPGMTSGATIDFQVFEAMSNNESQVSFGNQNQSIAFYQVYKMKPVSLNNYENYFQLSGLVDLGIPRVDNNFTGILEFSKKNGVVAMELKTLPVNFKGPGKVNFYNTSKANTQKLDPTGFEAQGKILDDEGVELLVTLYRKPSDIYLEVNPSGQILPIGDGVISLTDVKGKMLVKNNDWDYFKFDGIMTGAKGVEGQQRLSFTIFGDIEANSQQVSLKNINTPFGGMKITYDFKNGRMTGDLNISKNMGGINVNATANLLVDAEGYYIIAGGSATPPGIGLIQAGMMFGNYPSIAGETKNRLMQYSYDKKLPPTFANGIGGFFISGTKTFPIEIPDIDVDLKVVSVAFGAKVGADARVWMNFAGPGTSFGIGAMAFAHAYFVCQSMLCTSFGADARAELGMKGDFNTASGTFSLEGCGSITVSAKGEQCVGAFGACIDPCVNLGFTKSIKVEMLLNSQGSASIDLGLGNCSGQPPLTGGW